MKPKTTDIIGSICLLAGMIITAGCIENLIWPGILLGLVLGMIALIIGTHHEHRNETQVH